MTGTTKKAERDPSAEATQLAIKIKGLRAGPSSVAAGAKRVYPRLDDFQRDLVVRALEQLAAAHKH